MWNSIITVSASVMVMVREGAQILGSQQHASVVVAPCGRAAAHLVTAAAVMGSVPVNEMPTVLLASP